MSCNSEARNRQKLSLTLNHFQQVCNEVILREIPSAGKVLGWEHVPEWVPWEVLQESYFYNGSAPARIQIEILTIYIIIFD